METDDNFSKKPPPQDSSSPCSAPEPATDAKNEPTNVESRSGSLGAEERKNPQTELSLPFVEEEDLVFVHSLGTTAIVEQIGGQSSSEDDSSSEEDDDLFDDDLEIPKARHQAYERALNRGVENNWNDAQDVEDDSQDDEDAHDEENEEMDETPSASDDDDDVESIVPEGSAMVIRVDNGDDVVVELNDLKVLDRMFYPGQMVLSAVPGDKNVQSGTVVSMEKTLTVRRMHDYEPGNPQSSNETFEVPAERVLSFCDLRIDAYCVHRDWLGIIEYFKSEVVVDFPDGSAAIVMMDSERLKPFDPRISPQYNPDVEGFFFPGMKVKGTPRYWRDAYWLRGKYRRKQRTGVVRCMKHSGVGVHWIAVRQNMRTTPDSSPPAAPPELLPYSDIQVLDAQRHLIWCSGDFGFLAPEESNEEEQWEEQSSNVSTPTARDERQPTRPRSSRRHNTRVNGRLIAAQRRARELTTTGDESDSASMAVVTHDPTTVVQILETRTKIAVQWQNGVIEENIPSVNLRVNEHLGSSDFWPGMVVSRASEDMDEPNPAPEEQVGSVFGNIALNLRHPNGVSDPAKIVRKALVSDFGMVVRVDLDERTAVVRWLKPNSRDYYEEEEEVSVYDLVPRIDYDMHLGDTVLVVAESDQPRWVGQIIGKDIGDLEVQWLDGTKSHITPDQVIAVGEQDEDAETSSMAESEYENDSMPFETGALPLRGENPSDQAFRDNWGLDESSYVSLKEAVRSELDSIFQVSQFSRVVFSSAVDVESAYGRFEEVVEASSNMLEVPEGRNRIAAAQVVFFAHAVAIRIVTTTVDGLKESSATQTTENEGEWPHPSWNELKTKVFNGLVEYLEGKGVRLSSSHETRNDATATGESTATDAPIDVQMQESYNNAADSSAPMDVENIGATVDETEERVPSFEILDDFDTHHYLSKSSTSMGQTRAPGFASIVRKEWTRLSKNLPPGIFVHACERFQDLMRVAIVGPKDTPYEDVLFFFDMFLPYMYPAEPPKVFFYSFGRRLNPNLYENGKVCLSLLGTWDGDDVEQWDPRNSNVLRVLLSLQAMVFVDEPYYNEAGYQKQRGTVEGQTNSRTYNEKALLDCQLHLIQSVRGGTPKDFKELQLKHYKKSEAKLIERLQAMCAEDVSKPDSGAANGSAQQGESYTSRGFKRSLKELVPRVKKALEGLGNA